jgi:MYXO-CTERM domain-containing protein
VGNEAFVAQQFTAVKPVTDLTVSDVRLASDRNGVVREGQSFVAKVEQVGGVAPLPVTVVFEAAGRTASFNVTVPASGPVDVTWNSTLRGGTHTVVARAIGPAIANETNPGNEERSAQVEVFLGRITVGNDTYVIRADSRGLPAVALLSGSSKTYPLTVVDQGAGIAYQFTVAGNRTLTWDPLVPVSSVAAEEAAEGGKDAPFPGLVMVLLVLALAGLAQRRRWT